METIGSKIKKLRIYHNLTQEELSKKIGYTSRTTINKIENDLVDLPLSKVVAFAEALGTTPTYLLGIENNDYADGTVILFSQGNKQVYNLTQEQFDIISSMLKQFNKG